MMNLDYDWPILECQDIAKNFKKCQFPQNLINGSDIYEHVHVFCSTLLAIGMGRSRTHAAPKIYIALCDQLIYKDKLTDKSVYVFMAVFQKAKLNPVFTLLLFYIC